MHQNLNDIFVVRKKNYNTGKKIQYLTLDKKFQILK